MTQNGTMERIEAWLSAFMGTLLSFFFLLVVVLPNQWAIRIPLPLFLLLLFTIVIKTISGRDSAVHTFWKWRLSVDAAVSVLAMLVSEWLL